MTTETKLHIFIKLASRCPAITRISDKNQPVLIRKRLHTTGRPLMVIVVITAKEEVMSCLCIRTLLL